MALSLTYPLKKGTYRRVRGFSAHVKSHPGTWYGIDDGCKTGTPLYAVGAGKVSHSVKQSTGGGYNFRLNLTRYPGWFLWYAHCSSIPSNGKVYKEGQVIGKSGATGGVTGPHLHYSLMQGSIPRNPDSKSVVKWEVDMYKGKNAESWYKGYQHALKVATTRSNRFGVIAKRLAKDLDKPTPKPDDFKTILSYLDLFVTKLSYENALQYAQAQYDRINENKLANHARETEILQEEIDVLKTKVAGLDAEIMMFKEPKGVKIPRVTKFDNLWDKIRKRILQFISSRKKVI